MHHAASHARWPGTTGYRADAHNNGAKNHERRKDYRDPRNDLSKLLIRIALFSGKPNQKRGREDKRDNCADCPNMSETHHHNDLLF
jgi:hypothetical protein